MASKLRFLPRLILVSAFGPIILFLAAGDPSWTMGWIFSIFTCAYSLLGRLALFIKNPDLIIERAEALKKDNVEPWDRKMLPLIGIVLPTLTVILAGLNRRFHWPPDFPAWVQAAAYVPMFLGGLLAHWAAMENTFFSAVVRIQEDRGQTVVTTGPYRYIRHPGYAGGLIFNLFVPVALGSLWALLPVLAMFALTLRRTTLEDRTLYLKLRGYREYAGRTRWRLVPGIW